METSVSYSLEIKDEYRCFYDTVEVYQEAVSFLISVVSENYDFIESAGNQQYKQRAVRSLYIRQKGTKPDTRLSTKGSISFQAISEGARYQPHWVLSRATEKN